MQRLLQAIQLRKLDRIAVAYAVTGWILVQGASIVFSAFDGPAWALRAFIVGVVVGFPTTLTIAWFAAPQATGGTTVEISHREVVLFALLGVMLLLSLGEFVFVVARAPSAPKPIVIEPPADASIAVLAFNNMSGNPENEYFSDGISEELLNDLAQLPGLRVAARTSSFSFKGKSVNIEDIGRALNVRAVLEGSVRRAGNHARITAQLINVADGYHLWSKTYDRDVADLIAVEDEIARAITHELTGHLLPAAGRAGTAKSRIDPDAYTAFLQGRFFMNKRNRTDMLRAADLFKQAIQLRPDYADAHASLGLTYALLYTNGQRRDTLPAAKDETAIALRLDPENFQALLTSGIVAAASWDWLGAEKAHRAAVERNPNNADAQHHYSVFLYTLNLPLAAIAPGRRAAMLDPLAPIMRNALGDYYRALNRKAEAANEYRATLTLDPNFVFALGPLCQINADFGKIEEARKILVERLLLLGEENATLCRVSIALRVGDLPELKRLSSLMPRLYASGNFTESDVGWVNALAGNTDQAIRWFEKAYDEHDSWIFYYVPDPDLPAELKADPRWKALMQRPLLRDWKAAHDRVALELAAGK